MTEEGGVTGWARLLADSMIEAGLKHVVLSPGSRSTPFAWALLERPELECLNVLDERSAGFVALGQAKLTGRPSLLLSTSGTAPAHYYPSVVEAANSYTPLVVLTADRPGELADSGAPQTTDQLRLYGAYSRIFVELGVPDESIEAARGLRRRVVQALVRSRWPTPGPVQINARLRKPLEPDPLAIPAGRSARALGDGGPPQVFLPNQAPDQAAIDWLARQCQAAERGLIVCGAALPWQAVAPRALALLAESTGFPVLAEATSQHRFGVDCDRGMTCLDGFEPLLRSSHFRRSFRPDCVLCFGAPLLSSGWERLTREHPALPRHAIHAWGWPDVDNCLASLTLGDPTLVAEEIARTLRGFPISPARRAWAAELGRANELGWQAVNARLTESWNEGHAVRTVVESMPDGSLLALGNSLPLRDVDLYVPASRSNLGVWSQRGTNGIDGLLAGAAGAALAGKRPTVLLLGDLSFLHDAGSLWTARALSEPLVVVVLHNQGGRIFEQLPLAHCPAVAGSFEPHWVLPHQLELTRVAEAYGLRAERITRVKELREAVRRALGDAGCTVLEVPVPPRSATDLLNSVVAQVDRDFALLERTPN